MKAYCNILIDFDDAEKLKTIIKSIEIDDFYYVKSQVIDKRLEANIESKSISSLIHTLDDYLACISVAEKVVGKN